MKRNYQYMHLIEGRPGYFDGEQIVFAMGRDFVPLYPDLATIKRHQRAARKFRNSLGCYEDTGFRHLKIKTPTQPRG